MLTYADLSELTGVSENTLRQWNLRGKLPPSTKLGSTRVWEVTPELQAWLREMRTRNVRPDEA